MIQRTILLSALLCLMTLAAQAQQPSEFLMQGNDAYQKNNYKLAIELYSSAISGSPSMVQAYYNRALCYMQTKQTDKALKDLTKTIELDPRFKDAYLNRSFIYIVDHRVTEALPDLTAFIKLDSANATAYFNRGQALLEMGKNDSAMADFNKALKLDTTMMSAYLARGVMYARQGKNDLAERDLRKATTLNPAEPLGWLNYGQALLSNGKADSAGAAWRTFLTMERGTDRARQVDTILHNMSLDSEGVINKTFQDTGKLVSISLPPRWHANTQDDGKVFNFFVSLEKLETPQDNYSSGVAVHMVRNAPASYDIKEKSEKGILSYWKNFLDEACKDYNIYTINSTTPIKIGTWHGEIRDITSRIKAEYYSAHKLEAIVVRKNDVLWITAECPVQLWPAFRDRFRKAIETMRLP